MTVRNKAFRKAMEKAGLDKVQLEKNEGYFWIWSDDSEMNNAIMLLDSQSIYVYAFNHMSIEDWVKTIKEMIEEGMRRQDNEEV